MQFLYLPFLLLVLIVSTHAAPPAQRPFIEPFTCSRKSFLCSQDAVWACDEEENKLIISCASMECAKGRCTWPGNPGWDKRGAKLVIPMGDCCGVEGLVLDVPEHTDFGALAWGRFVG